jgi:hypothetical protein
VSTDRLALLPQPLCAARPLPRPAKQKVKFIRLIRNELADLRERRVPAAARVRSSFSGKVTTPDPRRVALYAHYNPYGRVSGMVLKQLELLRDEGFDTLFVSMSPIKDPAHQTALEPLVRSVIVRKSFGRDFGAWHDIARLNETLVRGAEEVLLINDSMLGPFFPLGPIFEGMLARGEGLFGLTDSPDRSPHLQSYFLLFRGQAAIAALWDFLGAIKLSFVKDTMIRRGEVRLSKFISSRGVPQWASFPFDQLERHVVADARYLEPLLAAYGSLSPLQIVPMGDDVDPVRVARMSVQVALMRIALNPTHYYWRALIEAFGFPYVKTNLITENPACIPDIDAWRDLVPDGGPVTAEMMVNHMQGA